MARYIKTDILAKIVFDKWQECDELKHIIPAIRNAVMCASTADVRENVHAHWEDWSFLGFDVYRHWARRCSNCFWEREDDNEEKDTPFCPNCGAQMDERRDDAET